jgi:hypothetical protein
MTTSVKKAANILDSLGLITGGSIADTLGWRWSQYIVAIIDGGVLVLLFVSFEETLFPRFLISDSTRSSSSLEIDSEGKNSEGKTPNTANIVDVAIRDSFPKRTLIERIKPWSFYPEDRTTYWQYFRRPFFLLSFPNVIIVNEIVTSSCANVLTRLFQAGFIFAFGCTAGIVSFNTISEILTSPPYKWFTTSTGLVFFAALVGNFVGWATGTLSDQIVILLARRNGGVKEPEMRLWTLKFSMVYALLGYFLYGWGAQTGAHWMSIAFGVGA